MEEILKNILNPDNTVRREAEASLETAKEQDSQKLMEEMFAALNNTDDQVANLACVLFKKYFLETETTPKETLQVLQEKLFEIIDPERAPIVLHAQGSVIVKVFAKLEDFRTLLDKIIELSKHENAAVRELSYHMLDILVDVHIPQELASEYISSFKEIFKQGLSDSDLKVKVASFKATSSFITSLSDNTLALQFSDIVEGLLSIMIDALKEDENAGKATLESFIDMADFHPDLFKEYGTTLVDVVSQIMLNTDFEDGTRSSAKEILLSLANKAPGVVRKLDNLKTDFYPALFKMITEVTNEDDIEEWAKEKEEEDITRSDPHAVAREALLRFSRIVGENITIEASIDLIKTAITDEDWKKRQAGYYYLGYIAESCKKILSKDLEETMRLSAAGVVDSHPRVQYAGLTCLGLMITEQAPKAQKKYHAEIMPQLMSIMKSDCYMKIKTQATSAAVSFVRELIQVDEQGIEETEREVGAIEGYTDDLLNCCADLFTDAIEKDYPALQEEVLALISCIATLIEEKFAVFYPKFMPGLIQIIQNTPNETVHQKDLRSNTIQTIGFLMDAIKNSEENMDQFKDDAKNIVEIFSQILTSDDIKEEDPQVTAITNALTQAAAVLKDDFAPYLPAIMEKLLEGAKSNVDFKLEDALLPTEEQEDNMTSVTFKMKGMEGQKKLSLNTNALETKINSVQVLRALAENLKATFFPFVEKTYEVLSELFEYKYSKAVRLCSVECCQYLIEACTDATMKEQIMGAMHIKFETGIQSSLKKSDSEEIVVFLKEYYHCIKLFEEKGAPVSPSQIENLVDLMAKSCHLASEEKKLTLVELEKNRENLDEEDVAGYREALDEIEKAFLYSMEVAGQYMRLFKADVTQIMKEKLFTLFVENMSKSENTEHEVIDGLCFLIDCCEFLSIEFFQEIYQDVVKKFVEIYEKHKNDEDRDVVQSLSFGLGVVASRLPNDQYAPLAEGIHNILEEVISVPDPMSEENNFATENALSSLLKIVMFQKDGTLITDDHAKKYLGMLPLKEDLDEALAINKIIIEQVEKQNQNILATTGAEVEAALNRIAELHHNEPELKTLNEEYAQRLSALLQSN
ncbi:unnamed protein product [Moneuplotes crassus]|uniref:TOG domain-containing protein n=1 Tax=Euplotes crassus TaxID=5936 RepID=A0AAD1XPG5_EUPCR|nr:unnamed protein product [Moneuplotes crassus]